MMPLKYYLHQFTKTILPYFARLHYKNWNLHKEQGNCWNNPQTWYLMPPRWNWKKKIPNGLGVYGQPVFKDADSFWYPLRLLLQKLCGWMTGHELSKTEWGYGGGNVVDRNCRWCDKLFEVPKQEEMVPNTLKDILTDDFKFRDDFNE